MDVFEYAYFNWSHHLLLGFQEQELSVDETITTSLETLNKNLVTFRGNVTNQSMPILCTLNSHCLSNGI